MQTTEDAPPATLPAKYGADFAALLLDSFYQQQSHLRSQTVTATSVLWQKQDRVPFSAIATFFGVSKDTLQQHWKRSQKDIFTTGRKSVLSQEITNQMFDP
jgi:hypothetical protein